MTQKDLGNHKSEKSELVNQRREAKYEFFQILALVLDTPRRFYYTRWNTIVYYFYF